MEVLATKIAELLDVTIEQAIALYPILRQQFIYYRVLDTIQLITMISFAVGLAFSIISYLEWGDYNRYKNKANDSYYEQEYREFLCRKKTFKDAINITITMLFLSIGASTLQVVLSPDLIIIMEFLK